MSIFLRFIRKNGDPERLQKCLKYWVKDFYPTDLHAYSDWDVNLSWGDMQHGRLHLMAAMMTGKGNAESLASDRMLLC